MHINPLGAAAWEATQNVGIISLQKAWSAIFCSRQDGPKMRPNRFCPIMCQAEKSSEKIVSPANSWGMILKVSCITPELKALCRSSLNRTKSVLPCVLAWRFVGTV